MSSLVSFTIKHANTLNQSYLCVLALFCLLLLFQSCREDLTGEWPVIHEDLVGDYLESHPEHYSEFAGMLEASGVMGLLKGYGSFTVFAPTNEAIERYYAFVSKDKGETITSYTELSLRELREFCYNHIIREKAITTREFHVGVMDTRSMSERFYSVSYSDTAIIINDNSPIVARDIELHNGIIHVLSEVITPAFGALAEVFEKDSSRFSIYVKALKVTDLYQRINRAKVIDNSYNFAFGHEPDPLDTYNPESKPTTRKMGFTILAVSDANLAKYIDAAAGLPHGIHSLADLEQLARYHYSQTFNHDADNITDRTYSKNYLNRFMSYHCFNRSMYSTRFIKDYFTPHQFPEYPMRDYIETMLEDTPLLFNRRYAIVF